MGSLLSRLFKKRKLKVRILLLGLDSAGKTTLLERLSFGEAPIGTIPTMGQDLRLVEHPRFIMALWDVGGQEMLRTFWRHHFYGTDCIIFLIDSSDRDRFSKSRKELHSIAAESELENAIFLILANKQDMINAMNFDIIKKDLCLEELSVVTHNPSVPMNDIVNVMSVSALTGKGITEAMEWMANILEKRDKRNKHKNNTK